MSSSVPWGSFGFVRGSKMYDFTSLSITLNLLQNSKSKRLQNQYKMTSNGSRNTQTQQYRRIEIVQQNHVQFIVHNHHRILTVTILYVTRNIDDRHQGLKEGISFDTLRISLLYTVSHLCVSFILKVIYWWGQYIGGMGSV